MFKVTTDVIVIGSHSSVRCNVVTDVRVVTYT